MRLQKALVPALVGLVLAGSGIAPARATPSPSDCLYIVTAAGNGYQSHYGQGTSGPVAGTMYTGQEYDILVISDGSSDGYNWVADASAYPVGYNSSTIWYPTTVEATGIHLMTKEADTCSRLDI